MMDSLLEGDTRREIDILEARLRATDATLCGALRVLAAVKSYGERHKWWNRALSRIGCAHDQGVIRAMENFETKHGLVRPMTDTEYRQLIDN
jgi:hypothetical protein